MKGSDGINKYVKEVKYIITNGVTEPAMALLDDDTIVVLKYFKQSVGKLVLFNEYFCYRLACEIDLSMPKCGICVINENTVDKDHVLPPESKGYAFYSTYIKCTTFKPGIIKHLSNKLMFYKLLAFDHLIFNYDRNVCNLITTFLKKDTNFTVIDHSHVFKNGTIWDANCFKYGMEEDDYLSKDILESNASMYGMFFSDIAFEPNRLIDEAQKIKNIINEDLLDKITDEIPDSWMPSERDIKALKEYLLYRNNHLMDTCDMIINERR